MRKGVPVDRRIAAQRPIKLRNKDRVLIPVPWGTGYVGRQVRSTMRGFHMPTILRIDCVVLKSPCHEDWSLIGNGFRLLAPFAYRRMLPSRL